MKHSVVYKKKGLYTGWPLPAILPDGSIFTTYYFVELRLSRLPAP